MNKSKFKICLCIIFVILVSAYMVNAGRSKSGGNREYTKVYNNGYYANFYNCPANINQEIDNFPGQLPKQTAFVDIRILNEYSLNSDPELLVKVSVKNTGKNEQDNVMATVYVPRINVKLKRRLGDIEEGETKTEIIRLNLPEKLHQGYYYLKTTINNDEFNRGIYREFLVREE